MQVTLYCLFFHYFEHMMAIVRILIIFIHRYVKPVANMTKRKRKENLTNLTKEMHSEQSHCAIVVLCVYMAVAGGEP